MVAALPWMVVALLAVQDRPAAVPAGWQTYNSAKGGFSAACPGKPSEVVKKVTLGDEAVSLVVATVKKGPATFSVSAGEVTNAAKQLDNARDEPEEKGQEPISAFRLLTPFLMLFSS